MKLNVDDNEENLVQKQNIVDANYGDEYSVETQVVFVSSAPSVSPSTVPTTTPTTSKPTATPSMTGNNFRTSSSI